jgi:uncharacterized phage protein gp47/JayE
MSNDRSSILTRLLSNISNTYNKTVGSFFRDFFSPISIELETLHTKADEILNKGFVDTATGVYLDKVVVDVGLTRKLATQATTTVTIIGAVGAIVNIGDKVASDSTSYLFTESKIIDSSGMVTVNVKSESYGSVGNVPIGAIKYFPKTLSGLYTVTNTSAITDGYNEETDVELRARYYAKVQTPTTSGNAYHYKNWSTEVNGVGDAKVIPLWSGNGTVKVIIVNSNMRAADTTLINNVIANIEANRPIGATITVISASEKAINISVTLSLEAGYTLDSVKATISNNVTDYLKTIAFKQNYVSYAKIGSLILGSEGVLDHSGLLINNGTANITVGNEEIAVMGVI